MHEKLAQYINRQVSGAKAQFHPPPKEVGDSHVMVEASSILEVCQCLRDAPEYDFSVLQVVTGVDYPGHIEICYVLASYRKNFEMILKTKLPKASEEDVPQIDSVSGIWKAANWQERECYDMVGVTFKGHPDPRRILTGDDWEGFPLRKAYVPAKSYNGMEINPEAKMNIPDREFAAKQREAQREALRGKRET